MSLLHDHFFCNRLLNNEGALLAYSGYDDKNARVTAAIASNLWGSCVKNGNAAFNEDQLNFMLMDAEVMIIFSYFYSCKFFIFFFLNVNKIWTVVYLSLFFFFLNFIFDFRRVKLVLRELQVFCCVFMQTNLLGLVCWKQKVKLLQSTWKIL